MAEKADFTILGLDEVLKKLGKLNLEIGDAAGKRALRKAARIVAKAARQNALLVDDPKTGRRIRDNIRLQFASRTYRKTGDIMYRVGVSTRRGRIPKGNPDEGKGGNTPHWEYVELGTENARAQPFLRPALSENVNKVIDTLVIELDKEINKVLNE
ncbi:TPA: HK97 gp10 family phage protein [Vibrio cholerae]|uniref:HK97-gp10 family putative phage morphogenesis protein n=1 Tax=Vibrio cholerae TaxID=666 RepID=UPI0011DB0C8C|nr:HK97-gp10 family putative phage morphogenesis protein [Vibrio cholerae]EKF9564396.1 HK97 gp10 family phage protein [Vibrio cholerae]MVB50376.1 HK97 gp10 family phage protein [Vibrio cholerae]TXX76096.1 HK97 gp10 family phage protein [Vibrio cholerae]GIA27399.1 Putative phage protein, HK97 gp10 family [Vibrio cholerae]HAS4952654.1 HK97 gp10 family phage protein [Vibrio cholerae]